LLFIISGTLVVLNSQATISTPEHCLFQRLAHCKMKRCIFWLRTVTLIDTHHIENDRVSTDQIYTDLNQYLLVIAIIVIIVVLRCVVYSRHHGIHLFSDASNNSRSMTRNALFLKPVPNLLHMLTSCDLLIVIIGSFQHQELI
jgi:hypothetical protein